MTGSLFAMLALSYIGIFGFLGILGFKLLVIKQTEMQIKVAQLEIIQRLAEQYEVVARSEPPGACQT